MYERKPSDAIYAFLVLSILAAAVIAMAVSAVSDDWNKRSLEDIVHSRVVMIEMAPGIGTMGTGFLVAPDVVLTAGHVAENLVPVSNLAATLGRTPQVVLHDGKVAKIDSVWHGMWDGKVLPGGSGTDIALVFLAEPVAGISAGFPRECSTEKLTYGADLTIVGTHTTFGGWFTSPLDLAMLFTEYREYGTKVKPLAILENFATAAGTAIPGMSGSAVLNTDHELMGVAVAVITDAGTPLDMVLLTVGPVLCDVIEHRDELPRTPVIDAAE